MAIVALVVAATFFFFDKLSEGGIIGLFETVFFTLLGRDAIKDENSVIKTIAKKVKGKQDEVSKLSDDSLANKSSKQ